MQAQPQTERRGVRHTACQEAKHNAFNVSVLKGRSSEVFVATCVLQICSAAMALCAISNNH